MARFTPASGGTPLENPLDLSRYRVQNLAPYRARLKQTFKTIGAVEFGSQPRLGIDWALVTCGLGEVRDYCGFALGENAKGPATLRQICNAIAGVDPRTEISFFDDETLEWGYQGAEGPAWGALEPGWEVTVHGEIVIRNDRQGSVYNISHYYPAANSSDGSTPQPATFAPEPVATPRPAPAAPTTPQPAAAVPANRPGSTPPAAGNGGAPTSAPAPAGPANRPGPANPQFHPTETPPAYVTSDKEVPF